MTPYDSERVPAVIDMARATYAPPLHSFQDEEPEEAKLPLSQYLWILKRYRWRILGFCAAAVILTVIVSARLTPIYEATTTVDIDRATPSDVVGQDSGRAVFSDAEQFLATQMKLVESDSVLRPVDQRFNLRKLEQQSSANGSPEGEASPVKLKQLKVTRPPSTYLMQVSYRSSDPVLAADAANAIAQSYLEHTYNIRVRASANMATFMERQLEELKNKMEESGKALVGFERDLSVINPEEKTNILASRLLQLNTDYVRREFLGEIRALVFDVSPVRREPGRFLGRIWVDEASASIVRFNGTYVPTPPVKNAPPDLYFHFDSWRTNSMPGIWVPDHIYVEEEQANASGAPTRFKAQTRVWDYAPSPTAKLDELTQILIESENHVNDASASRDVSPLESQRAWERQAEENVLSRLEKGGFLAPTGPVDDVLNTVVDNLIISGKLNADARCRVLLTTPIETFSIGHTIVISRGLIDVLPDEASLALVLADELSHIVLGHRTPTQFAFYNQTMLNDADLLVRLRFERTQAELDEAGTKTIEIMRASPYQKTANAGLFLKALASRSSALPRLLAANLGNQVANTRALERLAEFTASAPELEEAKLEQIAALPLGSRIKLNPWNDQISLAETKPISLLSAREKMPFEITPSVPFLTLAH
ncbi:MAG: M48 family metalloprotease [Bryobacteraceae bacterium]